MSYNERALRVAARTDTDLTEAEARRSTARRIQEAAKNVLRACREYPDPDYRAKDIMGDRAAIGNHLAYLLHGAKAEGATKDDALAFVFALAAEVETLWPDGDLPHWTQASIEDAMAEGAENVEQLRAHVTRSPVQQETLERCLTRSVVVKTRFLMAVQVARRTGR